MKVIFLGSTNNDMLRLQMELEGPFRKKMLHKASLKFTKKKKQGAFFYHHFDQDISFCVSDQRRIYTVTGKVTNHIPYNFYNYAN